MIAVGSVTKPSPQILQNGCGVGAVTGDGVGIEGAGAGATGADTGDGVGSLGHPHVEAARAWAVAQSSSVVPIVRPNV